VSNGRETGRSYDSVARHAAQIADELTGKPFDRGLLGAFVELAAVADGCGPVTGAYLTARGVHHRPDLSPEMCAIARHTAPLHACAADMTSLPLGSGVLSELVCMYAVIHLDGSQRCRLPGVRPRARSRRAA
jgi:hypothetical protein